MTTEVYVNILNEMLLIYAEQNMPLKLVFQQNNNPKHTRGWLNIFLSKTELQVLKQNAQFSDPNPIGNLWVDIKEAVCNAISNNMEEVWQAVQPAWNNIPVQRCKTLIDAMLRRCAFVLENKGYTTKY